MSLSPSQQTIKDFIHDDNLIAFYPSGVDATPCVEYRAMGTIKTAQVEHLAETIIRHNTFMAKLTENKG